MSEKYEPKKGDRVRVTVEGTVTQAEKFYLEVGDCGFDPRTLSSIERLSDPLPTTPGSVVALDDGGTPPWYYTLAPTGEWVRAARKPYAVGTEQLARATVIFDAGKAES